MSYYLKYRPQRISELDLKSVRDVLLSMLRSGKVAHAYLFVGPRGLGKTSTARILAKLVNCEKNKEAKVFVEPCGECSSCKSVEQGRDIDVIEIDAASNRGIDAIRELRDKIGLAPVAGLKKVYIIDEVHMLTLEAFNALLKTLEEPPAHAMFVLCTTEEHKIPETVISRCVRVPFVKAAADEVVESLHKVIDGEKLSITKEAIAMLANSVDGCFREGHKLLEQLAQKTGTVEVYDVEALVDGAQGIDPHIFANALVTGDAKAGLEEINRLEKSGVSFVVFSNKLVEFLRNEIRANYGIGEKKLTNVSISRLKQVTEKAMSSANEVKRCVVEQLPLEILAVELGDMTTTVVTQSSKGPTEVPKEKDVPTVKALKVAEAVKEAVKETETKEVEKETDRIVGDLNVTLDDVNKKWSDILSALTPKNHSVAGLLRSTKPKAIEGKYLVLEVFYKFHKEQLEQDIKRRMLEETLAQLVAPLSIRCILGEKVEQTLKTMPEHDNIKVVGEDAKLAEAVEDVFGLETH